LVLHPELMPCAKRPSSKIKTLSPNILVKSER
jgi:hypothetical protein